jgi:hypothetical protein
MLDPNGGLATMMAGALLIGIGMGVCNIVFLVVVQGSVTWNERGIATASTLFSRTIGQTIGAGLAGAILNFGISRRAPAFGDALDLLLEPSRLKSFDAQQIAHLVGAVASSLHDVYIVAAVLAAIALAVVLLLPAGLSPTRPATK